MKTKSWLPAILLGICVVLLSTTLSLLGSWLTAKQLAPTLQPTTLPTEDFTSLQKTQTAALQARIEALSNENGEMKKISETLQAELTQLKRKERYQYLQETFDTPPTRRAYVFHLLDETVESLSPLNENLTLLPEEKPAVVVDLPDELIIPPGDYRFLDKVYRLKNEGLYRFVDPFDENHQRIVFSQDVHALLSGVAWSVSHGEMDNGRPQAVLVYTARTRKLSLTCGSVTGMALSLLKELGIPSRSVHTFPLENFDGFDDGHVMLEVFRADLGRWVLYDLDNNLVFMDQSKNQLLSLVELMDRLPKQQFEMRKIAIDTPLDISNFTFYGDFDGSLYYEAVMSSPEGLKRWVAESFIPAAIYQDGILWGIQPGGDTEFPEDAQNNLENLEIELQMLDTEAFIERFYTEAP